MIMWQPLLSCWLALQFYELARKEIAALIVADEHPNIVRCFAMEEDREFVYLALERCKHSLNDALGGGKAAQDYKFVSSEGHPTELAVRVGFALCCGYQS